jgi:hypothetical protein
MLISSSVTGLIMGAHGPLVGELYPAFDTGYSTQGSPNGSSALVSPAFYNEIVFGWRDSTRIAINEMHAARRGLVSSNFGRLPNFFFARAGTFSGSVGDTAEMGDASTYYFLFAIGDWQIFVKP